MTDFNRGWTRLTRGIRDTRIERSSCSKLNWNKWTAPILLFSRITGSLEVQDTCKLNQAFKISNHVLTWLACLQEKVLLSVREDLSPVLWFNLRPRNPRTRSLQILTSHPLVCSACKNCLRLNVRITCYKAIAVKVHTAILIESMRTLLEITLALQLTHT